MRITATVKQVLYHTIDVDLNDYFSSTEEMTQTKICELYQIVKGDPMQFVNDTENGLMRIEECDESTIQSLEIK